MTSRRAYRHHHMVNRALFKVENTIELMDLRDPNWRARVRWIAEFYAEHYPTRDAGVVDRDAETVSFLWLQEHMKKVLADQDREQDENEGYL